MPDQSKTCRQATSTDTPSAIFSQDLVAGPTPCDSLDGPMTDLFGQAVAPASLSPAPAKDYANRMSATFGRIGQGSSESNALQRSLASRLMRRLPLDGLTTYSMIWKRKRTPALRTYYQLAVSGRTTSEGDSIGWPTPSARDYRDLSNSGKGYAASRARHQPKRGDAGLRTRVRFQPDPESIVRVDGLPRPVGQVRAFGNAIVPQLAAEFIMAYMEARCLA